MKNLNRLISSLALVLLFGVVSVQAQSFADGAQAYANEDYAEAYRIWFPLAKEGDAEAQSGIGDLYFIGQGVEQDEEQAFAWYRRAAAQGHVGAGTMLAVFGADLSGVSYEDGVSAYRNGDYARAYDIWLPLAEQGHVEAQFNLSALYISGRGVEQNQERAAYWVEQAAEQGHEQAQEILQRLDP